MQDLESGVAALEAGQADYCAVLAGRQRTRGELAGALGGRPCSRFEEGQAEIKELLIRAIAEAE